MFSNEPAIESKANEAGFQENYQEAGPRGLDLGTHGVNSKLSVMGDGKGGLGCSAPTQQFTFEDGPNQLV